MNKIREVNSQDTREITSEISMHLTKHASQRLQMRGISHEAVELALRFGKRQRARGGCFRRTIRKRTIQKIQTHTEVKPAFFDRLQGISIITSEYGRRVSVVTAMHI